MPEADDKIPVPSPPIPSPKSEDRFAQKTATATIWMAWFTGLLGITSVLTVCVLRNQLKEMRTDAADARDNVWRDQRAWVSVPRCVLDREPSAGDLFTIRCVIVNTGKSPALKVRDTYRLSIQPSANSEPDWKASKVSAPSVIPPSAQNDFWFSASPDAVVPKLAADLYAAGGNKVWIRSLISYSDVFGRAHWVKTCSYHTVGAPLDNFTACDDGNTTDDVDGPTP